VVASRFRADATLDSAGLEAFLGVEEASGTPVVLMVVSGAEATALEKAKKVEHSHLGRLLDVVKLDDGRQVAVAARIDGKTLEEYVRTSGKKEPVAAVRMALRVADALHALHDAGATHGFVHARSVVIEPDGREPPVLAFSPPTGTEPWHAPEHEKGSPTQADDAWAAASLLHLMLTGSRPRAKGYASDADVEKAGVTDAALRKTLLHCLAETKDGRGTLHDLRRELARWFVDHAVDEPIGAGPHHAPPPLPRPSTRPPAPSRAPPPPPKKRRIALFAGAAVVVGIVGAYGAVLLRPKKVELVDRPKAEPEPSAQPIELGEVPVSADSSQPLGNKLATCVAGYLPSGAFSKAPDLEWLCSETDPRVGGEKLHGAVVSGAPKGPPTEAMKIFARIGWYDMAAFAVVHNGCCPDARPISIPEGKSECAMDVALREVGDAVMASRDVEGPLKKYTESIHCELNHGGAKTLRHSGRPEGGEDTAFKDLLKRLD
jgi:hypothetical protein